MSFSSYQFTHAITRRPARSVINGLRTADRGDPDHGRFVQAHEAYVQALEATGASVRVEPELEEYPDSVFVEDAALCLKGIGILMRPGDSSRYGERMAIKNVLKSVMNEVVDLPGKGKIDGGDVLITESEVLIGLSSRTDLEGAEDLISFCASFGVFARVLDTPKELLHFKTGCGLLDEETIFSVRSLKTAGCFGSYRVIECPPDEEAAANLIRFNDSVLVAAAYPKTQDLLADAGYNVVPIDTSEPEKIDGGLSCMSLRFSV